MRRLGVQGLIFFQLGESPILYDAIVDCRIPFFQSRLLRGHTLLASPPELDIFFRTRCLVPSCECGSRFCLPPMASAQFALSATSCECGFSLPALLCESPLTRRAFQVRVMDLLQNFFVVSWYPILKLPFNGQNFQLWKFQIKTVLVAHDLLEIVEGTETKPEPGENNANATKVKEWTKKDAKAMFALSSSIDYSQLDYLVNCASANEMWKKLSNIHEQKSTSNKLALTTKFHEYRKSPNDSIAQHVAKIENIASQLKDIGQTVSDVMIMAKIISTLPSKYNAFISAWDSVPDTNQTMDKLRERLLREETRMSADDDIPRAFAATTIDAKNNGRKQPGDKKKSLVCNYCKKKPGHIARYCYAKKRANKSQKKENESSGDNSRTTAFVMSQPSDNFKNNSSELESFHTSDVKSIWFLDSGASRHLCCRRDWFSEFVPTRDDRVYMGNGAGLAVAGEGAMFWLKRSVNRECLPRRSTTFPKCPNAMSNSRRLMTSLLWTRAMTTCLKISPKIWYLTRNYRQQ
ncbi:unnamed protein product [Trichogramma brassicae]|uniref:Retrovirus-related Pol polyprotein from transposon TNT 1-94-like beta-barrel domain-containing protein n=1 Tax=Trichogramma brassicae TaxID=86971 RepID=A0A6H5J434_9HYME|nr:unnamed protein product [Trichogramma brassicae]